MSVEIFTKLSQDLTQLLETEYDHNVVIEVGNQQNNQLFKAHSIILYQRSLYFRQKLSRNFKQNDVIEIKLPNVSAKSFITLIKYIYSGVVSLTDLKASDTFDLLTTANELMFNELVEHFQVHLIDNHASWLRLNFSRLCRISFQSNNFKTLQQFCNAILLKHPSMIFDSDDLITLQENALISLIKDDELQMEESDIWDKVILWGKAKTPNLPFDLEQWTDKDFKSLKVTLQHCLPYIRYFQMSDEDIVKKIKPYRNILEKSLWDDILINRLVPDMIITSQILPPRKNSSSQLLPQRELMITLNSSIITLQHAAEISSWIDRRSTIYNITKIPYKFKLLLRGSKNGFDAVSFHMRCDNIPNTLIVLKVRDSNELLGGYNPLIWNAGDGYARTSDSFVFSLANGNLNKSILSRVSDASSAICQSSLSQGPWFGDNDLGMSDSINPKKWLCKKYAYEKPIRSSDGWFFVDEYEVFQISKTFKS